MSSHKSGPHVGDHRRSLSSACYDEITDNSKPFPSGLPNCGNTCYINAALQCMLTVKPLVEWLLKPNSTSASERNSEAPIKFVLSKLVASMFSQDCNAELNEFLHVFRNLEKRFEELRQHDAQEFLLFLLSRLQNESASGPHPPEHKVQEIFEGALKSRISCPHCVSQKSYKSKESKHSSEAFFFLSVPIPVSQNEIHAATLDDVDSYACYLNVVFNEVPEALERSQPICYRRLLRLRSSMNIESVYDKVQSSFIQGSEQTTKNRVPLLLTQVTSTGFGTLFLEKSGYALDLTDGLNVEDNFCDLDSAITPSAVKRSLIEGDAVYIIRLNTGAATSNPSPTCPVAIGGGGGVFGGESRETSTMKTSYISTSPLSRIDSEVSGLSSESIHEPASIDTDKANQNNSLQLLMVHVQESRRDCLNMSHGSTVREEDSNAVRATTFRRFSPPFCINVLKVTSFEELCRLAVQSLTRFWSLSLDASDVHAYSRCLTFWAVDALPGEQEINSRYEFPLFHSVIDESSLELPDWLTKARSCECPRLLRLLVVWPTAPHYHLTHLRVEVDKSLVQPPNRPQGQQHHLTSTTTSEKNMFMSSSSPQIPSTELTIENCLREYIKPTKVQQSQPSSNCLNCKKLTDSMELRLHLEKAPMYLLLHLNRILLYPGSSSSHCLPFGGGNGIQKIHSFVRYPITNLDLSFMMETPRKSLIDPFQVFTRSLLGTWKHKGDACSPVYDLVAVCNHKGSMQTGHFTAYCRNLFTKQWWHYNDDKVLKVSPDQVVQPLAYILVYKRRGVDNDDDYTTNVKWIKGLLANHASREGPAEPTTSSASHAFPKKTEGIDQTTSF